MNGVPEHDPIYPEDSGSPDQGKIAGPEAEQSEWHEVPAAPAAASQQTYTYPDAGNYAGPVFLPPVPLQQARQPARSPHLGHLVLFFLLLIIGWAGAMAVVFFGLHRHLFGVSTLEQMKDSAPYLLGSEAILYVITLVVCMLIFPVVWRKGFLEGLHWNGAAALHRYRILLSTAFLCFIAALLSQYVLPTPSSAPIDKIIRAPGAAWIMFFFGITFAPFFEEMMFRGLMLPAFCTACDWIAEKIRHEAPPPLYENGNPQWSFAAMVFGSIAASVPFALMHAPQTGYSLGPFTLLVAVSLVLCWVRLSSRSLAASVVVHASYNFLLFSVMLVSTAGFRNMHHM